MLTFVEHNGSRVLYFQAKEDFSLKPMKPNLETDLLEGALRKVVIEMILLLKIISYVKLYIKAQRGNYDIIEFKFYVIKTYFF